METHEKKMKVSSECECVYSEHTIKKRIVSSTQEIETTYNKRIMIIDFDVTVYFCYVYLISFLYFFYLFVDCVCALWCVYIFFEWKMFAVSGTMHIGRGCMGMERKRYVPKFNKKQPYRSRSGFHPNMLWNGYFHNRIHRLCWCTS